VSWVVAGGFCVSCKFFWFVYYLVAALVWLLRWFVLVAVRCCVLDLSAVVVLIGLFYVDFGLAGGG